MLTTDGYVNANNYYYTNFGFRPVVCLKSDVKLVDNGDNTYSIKEQITARAEYNKDTNQIEVRIPYSDNEISTIMLNDTNKLSMTNTNGIITATTAGAVGKNTITITDIKGNTKKLKVTVPYAYGNKVFGYECDTEGVEWRLFHADDNNIYLIADDYIPYENLPTSKEGTVLNQVRDSNYKVYFSNILNDYTGSSWIRENTNPKALKWLNKYLNAYPESERKNIKAVAYMMDTDSWSGFAGDKAEYAIGGPTLELFCASYKVTHPDRYVECDSVNSNGYSVKWSNGSYSDYVSGFTQDEYNSIYIKDSDTKAEGMWLASPSTRSYSDMMCIGKRYGVNNYSVISYEQFGLRPIVCLKSDVKLVDNGDNTYSIKEAITAKAEYNKDTNLINLSIPYSEYEISTIMLNDTNKLIPTNTNGIIIANTAGISLTYGTYTIAITDIKGNTKKLEVVVPVSRYYGKEVTNYTCTAEGVDTWRVFHVDDKNIYLIADDYVPYDNLPTSTDGSTKPNQGNSSYPRTAYFSDILSKYTGSAWIRANTNEQALKWLSWVNTNQTSINSNIKAVAYMMDTESWSSFAGDKAEYAIGGPTIELFCASYKVTHPDRYVECDSMNTNGYQVKWSGGSYTTSIGELTKDDYESIYIKSGTSNAKGMWLASPSADLTGYVLTAYYNGNVASNTCGNHYLGFRPLVCLQSGVQLVDNGDGKTCSIQ